MKNISLIILTLLCFQQVNAQRKLHFGLKASPNIGWLQPKSEGLNSNGAKVGFSYGLITDFVFNENYSFGTGIEINHIGGNIKYNYPRDLAFGTIKEEISMQYLQIPLTLKMRSKQIGYFTYYGQFGIGVSGLLSAKGNSSFDNEALVIKESDQNIYDDLKFFRASMILGVGTEYNISGTTSIVLGVSFNNGFVNALKGRVYEENDNGEVVEGDKKKANSNYISVNLGIIF